MNNVDQPLQTLQDIRKMMEKSSRFISLSGWSGISAGICALVGAWLASSKIAEFNRAHASVYTDKTGTRFTGTGVGELIEQLTLIAVVVFVAALVTAFLFTYLRSKKHGIHIWGSSAVRLLWNTMIPMIAGGFLILRMLDIGYYLLIAPCCLIFYGLALINGSKYTLGEVRYLGYAQVLLGLVNLSWTANGLLLWALGFGLLHIIYGIWMWLKYEKGGK